MGILGDLMGKVFGSTAAHAETVTPKASDTAPVAPTAAPAAAAPASAAPAAAPVDYAAVLDAMNEKIPQELDWRSSIVDLMKVVGMDSSLEARKKLAQELNYHGNVNDSASMNVWLHSQVLAKFAANGGHM